MTGRAMRRIRTWMCAGLIACAALPARGGPNLVAVGFFDLAPKQANVRYSLTDPQTVVLEFDGEHDFGRILVKSETPRSVARRGLVAGYTGSRGGAPGFLLFDMSEAQIQNAQVVMEFNLKGEIRPGRTYEYEIEMFTENEIQGGIPAIIPAFWADGKPFGVEVTLTNPIETSDKISRTRFIRGTVVAPDFEQMTSSAKIVLKLPQNFGQRFAVQRLTFREIDDELKAGLDPEMPAPVRYIEIKTPVEGQIFDALKKQKEGFLQYVEGNPDGYWIAGNQEDSILLTCSVVSALGELGDPKLEDRLRKAMDWLAEQEPPENTFFTTTTVGARLYTLSRFGGVERFRKEITRDMDYLVRAQYDSGGWSTVSYLAQSAEAANTQPTHVSTWAAMLALRESTFAGVECPRKVWTQAANYWTAGQSTKSGGFRQKLEQYGGLSENVSDEFTALGVVGMMISMEMASGPGARDCRQVLAYKTLQKGIDAALAFLNTRYAAEYSEELLGQLGRVENMPFFVRLQVFQYLRTVSGIPRLNDRDYFRLEAEKLFDPAQGLYDFNSGVFAGGFGTTAACMSAFALGASPTVYQRIVVGGGDAKDYEHSWDVQHLTRYVMAQRKRPLNWRRSSLEDEARHLLEVPVMFLNVAGPLNLEPDHLEKLRTYVFNGGTILINVVPEQESQRDVVASALRTAFPEYELRDLPKDHPVLTLREKIEQPVVAKVLGNGVRDFVFLAVNEGGRDWSCDFHTYRTGKDGAPHRFAFMNNLLEYTLDSSPFRSSFDPSPLPQRSTPTREFHAATLEIGGDQPVYPDLLKTLDLVMTSNYRTRIVDAKDGEAPLLWVMVTGPKAPTEAQMKRIRDHVEGGGFLIVDVVTGSEAWGEAALAALRTALPGMTTAQMRTLHPTYTGKIPGTQGFDARGGPLRKSMTSELVQNGRSEFSVLKGKDGDFGVFSHYDLSSGLTYNQFPGCRGLTPPTARQLAVNCVLQAMFHDKQN